MYKCAHMHMFALFCSIIIVRSFVELVKFLLQQPAIHKNRFYILSACFNQDPLESYFGNVRAAGQSDNPSVREMLDTADTLRLQGSMALDPVWGNSSRKRRLFQSKDIGVTDTPLPRAKKTK